MKKVINVSGVLAILSLFHSCAKNPVTGKRDLMLMSTSQEVAMGQQSDPEIVNFFGLYEDAKLQKFIEEKGQEMAAISHRKELKYEFKVVDSPVVNAFAVPGGYVYFTRGIMAHFNNEAEFAGVLGHEIGHITARHSAKQYSNAMLANIGLAAGMIFSPELAQFGDIASQGMQLLFLKFGRDAESQSDKLGVEYSTKIGYDAHEMAGFFKTLKRLSDTGGAAIPDFLSTHPDPADREKNVAKLADSWAKKTDRALEVNRESYLKMIDGLIYGEDPKQGFVENSIFYHPVLKFQFPVPAQWVLQNSPQQVQMAPKDGKAMMLLMLAEKQNSLENTAKSFLEKYQLTLVESKRENINGLPAIIMVADQKPQQGQQQQTVRALIYLIEHGGNTYSLLGLSAVNDFNQYLKTFQSTMNSFSVLTDAGKINRQPERVRIKSVSQASTLGQTLKGHQIPEARMEEIAVLNGMQLNDAINKGTLIKILEIPR